MNARRRIASRGVAVAVLAVLAGTTTAGARGPLGAVHAGCAHASPGPSYARSVDRALRAKEDVWGSALLARPGGPTYEGARAFLKPLQLARGPGGKPQTSSAFHYVAFTQPSGAAGSGSAALHVVDGSQILSRRFGGRSLTIAVGRDGQERYGSCRTRLASPRLAAGYLPILETRYVDADGVRYTQESFAAPDSRAGSLVSFVRLTVDARDRRDGVRVRFVPTHGSAVTSAIPSRGLHTSRVAWSNGARSSHLEELDAETYDAARQSVVRYWLGRLSRGATIDVPERRVQDAVLNLLIQNLGLTWRYSVGNPYQQFSFPESVDVAQVMGAYGFSEVASAILRRSLTTPSAPYPSWRIGQRLVGATLHFRLFRDESFIVELTPTLRQGVDFLAGQMTPGEPHLLKRERYSSDVPDLVYGLHSQAVAWQGVRAMAQVWRETGQDALATRCRDLASSLEAGLRRAVRSSERRLPDGSLFVPVRLLDSEQPYRSVTRTRSGSYWNLVVPYALASGLFAPGSREAEGVLRYMLGHGSRLLGLVRAAAYSLYGRTPRYPESGVNPVYGLNVARFLADNDRPDQLVLSLYGQLVAGMAPGTFVAGEAASVAPVAGQHFRSMYLPPNGASNASFLETLRLMLVHETRRRDGAPRGLRLAFSTPRSWLEPGRRIAVRDLPTSFGALSFSITSHAKNIRVSVDVPGRLPPRTLGVRLRLPRGARMLGVLVDGRPFRRFDRETATIDLSGLGGHLALLVEVART